MNTDQFAKFSSAVIRQLPRDLDPKFAQGLIVNQAELGKILREVFCPAPKALSILSQVGTVEANGAKKFIAKDHFKEDTSRKAEVKISWLGENFKDIFLGKTEEDVENATLTVHRLEKSSLDAPILAELGDRAETTLTYLYKLLKKQPNGEKGILLTNGYANIFYIRDANKGILWAVHAYWHGAGWFVNAYSVEYPNWWIAGNQVISR